ncbi:hypothetical protein AAH978_21630, partial [Streptomyces sp. ZYX-F-203]
MAAAAVRAVVARRFTLDPPREFSSPVSGGLGVIFRGAGSTMGRVAVRCGVSEVFQVVGGQVGCVVQ